MRLSVITYNIRGPLWKKEYSEEFARVIKKNNVDIICLQEVVKRSADYNGSKDIVHDLKKSLGGYYGGIEYLVLQSPENVSGNVILYNKSRLFPVGQEFSKRYALLSHRTGLEEFASKYITPFRKLILSQKFKMGDSTVIMYNAHLDFYGGDLNKVFQLRDFFSLWDVERNKNGLTEILVGDMNTWLPYKWHRFLQGFSLLRKFLHVYGFRDLIENVDWTQWCDLTEAEGVAERRWLIQNYWYKFFSKFNHKVKQKVDHVWGKGDFKVISSKRLDFSRSDHFPILVELDLSLS